MRPAARVRVAGQVTGILIGQASRDDGELTNFQRASVTLDASVKIYGSRVDSVHTIAFQTLSGLNRSSGADDGGKPLVQCCNCGVISRKSALDDSHAHPPGLSDTKP